MYDALRKHFLMVRKGRGPALPQATSANKLILQLDLLRQEGCATFI